MDMKMQINICFFMFTLIILIQIKFNIDINNDKLLFPYVSMLWFSKNHSYIS
jgi:hypothetical protein